MADTKITALAAITTVAPANDLFAIVDVSDNSMAASGTTKNITTNQILGAGGTATLASATITGNLTVRTNALAVDANNNVGIGTTAPTAYTNYRTLAIVGGSAGGVIDINTSGGVTAGGLQIASTATSTTFDVSGPSAGAAASVLFRTGAYGALGERYRIDGTGISTWSVGGSTAMTLNATGLGVGGSPTSKLTIGTGSFSAAASGTTGMYTTASGLEILSDSYFFGSRSGFGLMTLNASGNVGIGVTPSAWSSIYKVSQIGQSASVSGGTSVELAVFGSNCYFDTTDSRWERITSGYTSQYYQTNSTHVWRIGGTAGANTDCAFTSAMTLDASGNLLVGKTAVSDLTVGFQATQSGVVGSTRASSANAESTYFVYSTGAAAYRFYVGMGGTVYATNTTISGISDARLKENVQDLDVGLGAILALKPRKFDWKAGKGKDIKGDRGFIAQEFEQVFPQLVDEWKDEAPEGEAPYKSVRQDLIPVLVKAIQELTARVQTLEAK